MLASIIYNYGKFCDDFKSTLKLGAYVLTFSLVHSALLFLKSFYISSNFSELDL